MIKGLFLNTSKAQCSIYESGRMIFEALSLSNQFKLDYLEIDENHREIPLNYDFFAFNYHPAAMGWLNTRHIKKLPGLKLTFVLEVSPNNPFALCPSDDFDIYCALDPTIKIDDKRVYAFPRPLESSLVSCNYIEPEIPTIGSFGFATPGKGFELIVDAVSKEFVEAVVRINIPPGTYTNFATWKLYNRNYTEYLSELCKKVAKNGVEVIITEDYMTKDQLIEWCGQNTLNCFLYNRMQPGLSATTDQAITSGRPLAVSTNETFRHIHPYITPYPFRTLKESIALSQPGVLQMQKDWTPENFALRFETVLKDFNVSAKNKHDQVSTKKIRLKKKISLTSVKRKIVSQIVTQIPMKIKEKIRPLVKFQRTQIASISTAIRARTKSMLTSQQNKQTFNNQLSCRQSENKKDIILIVSHKEEQCGIHQYALNIMEALKKSTRYSFCYSECSSEEELHDAITTTTPRAIIYNYYPATMPWLTGSITRKYTAPQLGIMHEVTQEEADKADREMFDYHLCPDPTLIENNPIVFKTKRLIPPYINIKNLPDVVTIGSFGFGFGDKGFEHIVKTVQEEFDQAKIILHMPFNDILDKTGEQHALLTAKRCKQLVKKPGIHLVINHKFLTKQELLDFLASNTLNAFFYERDKHRGISSTIEHALAVQRPLAITKCGMFRHVFSATPSICIEDSSIRQIIDNDIAPLVPFYNKWSEAAFLMDFEVILGKLLLKKDL
ncbi:MAG: hypothetical protein Q7V05_14790 [Methanoregula sp.]|nr:hypothetical protein [Methanoregula sp.]